MIALPLQQHPRYAESLRVLGHEARMLDLDGTGQVLAIWRKVPVLGRIGYVPRGPVWITASDQARTEAMERLASQAIRLVEAEAPCPSLRASGFHQVATPVHVAELDFSGTPETRSARIGPKWKGALRQAERSGLRIGWEHFDGDLSHWLLTREAAMRQERRYRALPQVVACAFAKATPGSALILAASLGGEPVAGMLFLLHPPVATYHIGWSGDRGRACSAHHLLLRTAADRFADEGYVRLDLGSVDTEGSPGLARFKIGSGARVRALGGSWLRLPFARARG